MNEMRRDPITRKWVIIQKSLPLDQALEKLRAAVMRESKRWPNVDQCGLCPGNEDTTQPAIVEFSGGRFQYRSHARDWEIRVIPHRDPVFRIEGNLNRRMISNYDVLDAVGAHELIIETRDHTDWDELSPSEVTNILSVYRERMNDLSRDERFGHLFLYKNYGPSAKSQMLHPHSVLIASPSVPERIRRELDFTRKHFQMKERCLFCDIVSEEVRRRGQHSGLVQTYNHFVILSPFFAAHPFETWILPRDHNSDFRHVRVEHLRELAEALQKNISLIKTLIGPLSYSLLLFTRPNKIWGGDRDYWTTIDDDYHWHFKFIPRFPRVPGFHRSFAAGSGYMINQVPPETAAEILRSGIVV